MKVNIAYIAGYGRSGSTLLDTLLGNHPDLFGAGELNRVFNLYLQGSQCACGSSIRDCHFWREVFEHLFHDIPSLDHEAASRITLKAESLFSLRTDHQAYAALWSAMITAIQTISGCEVIVDSSKNSRLAHHRISMLRKAAGLPVRVVHLVRDPRAVMWSTCRGSDRRLEAGNSKPLPGGTLRTLLSWTYSNIAVESGRDVSDERNFTRLRYEELADNPLATLRRLERYLEIEPIDWEQNLAGERWATGHGVGGNRMRRKGAVSIRVDDEWTQRLPVFSRALVVLASPLLRKYGYN